MNHSFAAKSVFSFSLHAWKDAIRRPLGFGLLLLALGGLGHLHAQTTIGFTPNADQNADGEVFESMSSLTAWYIPFRFVALEDYSLSAVSLLLAGDANLADFSIIATAEVGDDLDVPESLTTFSATGSLTSTPTTYDFSANIATALDQNTTYYIRITYTGSDTADWVRTSGSGTGQTSGYSGSISGNYLRAALDPGYTGIAYYRNQASGGTLSALGSNQGFALTASAVPEPDTYALFFGIATLGFVALRRCRK